MKETVKNPFNYHGSKNRVFDQIYPHIPEDIKVFIDLFGGSAEVSVNHFKRRECECRCQCECQCRYLYNDLMSYITDLLEMFKIYSHEDILFTVYTIIDYYKLTKQNKEGYLSLRSDFNTSNYNRGLWCSLGCNKDLINGWIKQILFYVLCCYSFSHTICFNAGGEFNVPFGKAKSSFNHSLAKKLTEYCLILKQMDIKFSSMCFDNFMNTKTQLKPEETFVFIDPPYLLSDDSYSRTSSIKWTQEMEDRLFILMDNLIKNKYRFILTNFIELKGKKHKQLEEFISSNSLRIVELNSDYKRCNYQKDKSQRSVEVIVLNT